MNIRQNKKLLFIVIACFLSLILGLTLIIPIPYYAMQPGSALEVSEFVRVNDVPDGQAGAFYLTTISLKEGNIMDYLFAKVSDKIELVPEEEILGEESEEQYEKRQEEYMADSQNSAIIAAYHMAGKKLQIEYQGIEILEMVKDADRQLKTGDLIQKIDGKPIRTQQELIQFMKDKKAGDKVTVELLRDGKPLKLNVTLIAIEGTNRVGLGIFPMERKTVKADPPVEFHVENIAGPSAGLMFSLEILDQLLPENLTKGYKIAGTGTISETGEVGQIGGVEYKVMAAHEAGAQYFFCPKDRFPEDENEKLARQTAKKIGTSMQIVPVSSLKEAVEFLRKLPPNPAMST